MTITALFEIRLVPETVAQALAIIAKAVAETSVFAGCQAVELLHAVDDPARVIVLERWESLEHDAAYRAWRAGEGAIAELPPLLAAPPRLTRAVAWDDRS